MKKVVSLLLTLTLVFAIGSSVMAAEDIAPQGGTALPRGTDMAAADGGEIGVYDIAPRMEWTTTENTISIASGEMFLVNSSSMLIVGPETHLTPGTEYEFAVYYNNSDDAKTHDITTALPKTPGETDVLVPLREIDISGSPAGTTTGKLRLRTGKGGNAISDHELKLRGNGANRAYYIDLTTKDLYNTKMTDVTYTLVVSGNMPVIDALLRAAEAKVNPETQSGISFQVGYEETTIDDIDGYEEGDTITISNDFPVFKKKTIERIVKNYDYRAVNLEFEDGSWRYEGRMSGMGDTNFYTTQDVIPSLMNKLDQDFKFLILPAGVSFPTNGEMQIDVSDISDDWSQIYTYLYRDGKLTRINTTYDSSDDMIVFRTNYLGAFVMTDVEITDASIIGGEEESTEPETPTPEPEPSTPGTGTGTGNPNTGIPVGLNLIFGLGAVSLLGAGTVFARHKK